MSKVMTNRSTPPTSVVPVLSYPDVRAAVEWLTAAFGLVERTRIGESHRSQMSIGDDGAVIIAEFHGSDADLQGPVTHLVRVRVDDVTTRFERACAQGALVIEPPTDREYGERDCTVEDLAGHRWQFAETMRDVAPEEYGCQTVAPWPNQALAVDPATGDRGPAGGAGERDRLQYFLDQQRGAVVAIIDGLEESQLHKPVLASGWTPIGLVRHLAGAEALWFQWVVRGTPPEVTWVDGIEDPPYDPLAPFVTGHSSAAVIEQYRRQCEISNEILRTSDLDATLRGEHGLDWPDEPITDVRWVVLHMIEETARHAGHLDAARELLDGATGRGPR